MLSIRCNQQRPVGSTRAGCFPGRQGQLNNGHAGTRACRRGTLLVCQASRRRLPMICVCGHLGLGLELLEISRRPLHNVHPLSSPAWGQISAYTNRGPNSSQTRIVGVSRLQPHNTPSSGLCQVRADAASDLTDGPRSERLGRRRRWPRGSRRRRRRTGLSPVPV